MATDLGQAYVQIVPSAKGISGSIRGQLDPEASAAGISAGNNIAGSMIKIISTAIAAAGIGKLFSAALSEGADLQQSMGGIETLFKGSADKVKKYADEAYKTAGLSANDYMQNVTSFSASLLQSMGGDTEKAADKANMAMVDMADNSNKLGTSMESIQYAYQGFAKSNYSMLDNLKLGKPKKLAQYKPRENGETLNELRRRQYRAKPQNRGKCNDYRNRLSILIYKIRCFFNGVEYTQVGGSARVQKCTRDSLVYMETYSSS